MKGRGWSLENKHSATWSQASWERWAPVPPMGHWRLGLWAHLCRWLVDFTQFGVITNPIVSHENVKYLWRRNLGASLLADSMHIRMHHQKINFLHAFEVELERGFAAQHLPHFLVQVILQMALHGDLALVWWPVLSLGLTRTTRRRMGAGDQEEHTAAYEIFVVTPEQQRVNDAAMTITTVGSSTLMSTTSKRITRSHPWV